MISKFFAASAAEFCVGTTRVPYSQMSRRYVGACYISSHHSSQRRYNERRSWHKTSPFLFAVGGTGAVLTSIIGDDDSQLNDNAVMCEGASSSLFTKKNMDVDTMTMAMMSTSPMKGDQNYFHPLSYYYEKIEPDYENFWTESHAISGALLKDGLVERLNYYKVVPLKLDDEASKGIKHNEMKKKEALVADIKFGKNLNGHDGIVHGGIISLVFDESFGWAYEVLARHPKLFFEGDIDVDPSKFIVVTANLNVDYKKPLPAETDVVVRVYYEKSEKGKKIYLCARMESHDGSKLYSKAKVLFIKLDKERIAASTV